MESASAVNPELAGAALDALYEGLSGAFEPGHLLNLAKAGYTDVDSLRTAAFEDLTDTRPGLPVVLARKIINHRSLGNLAGLTRHSTACWTATLEHIHGRLS